MLSKIVLARFSSSLCQSSLKAEAVISTAVEIECHSRIVERGDGQIAIGILDLTDAVEIRTVGQSEVSS